MSAAARVGGGVSVPSLSPTPAAQMWTFQGAQLPGAELGISRISALARFFSCVHLPGYVVNSRSLVCPRISWGLLKVQILGAPPSNWGLLGLMPLQNYLIVLATVLRGSLHPTWDVVS